MLNTHYLIILALVCHTNRIISAPSLLGLAHDATALHDGGVVLELNGLSFIHQADSPYLIVQKPNVYTQDFRATQGGVLFHKDYPQDAELNLKFQRDLPQGRDADSENQPKAVIIGVSHNSENEAKILLTQRVENNKGIIAEKDLKHPEFPRGHVLKEELEKVITFERLAELRKGPLADVKIQKLDKEDATNNYILGVMMERANIDPNDKDLIPKLAANRELYEESELFLVLQPASQLPLTNLKPVLRRQLANGVDWQTSK